MKRYHVYVLGWYNNSDRTEHRTIKCDGMSYGKEGVYEFWKYINPKLQGSTTTIACYPIHKTVITKIEDIEEENN